MTWIVSIAQIRNLFVQFSKGQAIADHSKSGQFSPDFKWFDRIAFIVLDFKYLGFWISDPIRNPDYLQTKLF